MYALGHGVRKDLKKAREILEEEFSDYSRARASNNKEGYLRVKALLAMVVYMSPDSSDYEKKLALKIIETDRRR